MNQQLQAPKNKFEKFRHDLKGGESIIISTARRKTISPFVFVTQHENKAEIEAFSLKMEK
jgi:hypothetical protein